MGTGQAADGQAGDGRALRVLRVLRLFRLTKMLRLFRIKRIIGRYKSVHRQKSAIMSTLNLLKGACAM